MSPVIEDWFSASLDIEQIRGLVTVKPDPVLLGKQDFFMDAELFEQALRKIFVPNRFSLEFIAEVYGRARLHHGTNFSNYVSYISRIYNPPEVEVFPICLTGLAGIGKSQTIAALRRILPLPIKFSCDHYHGDITLVSNWYNSARGKLSGKALLADFLSEDDPGGIKGTLAKTLLECRRRSIRDGVSLVVLDETQHISTGLASAKVTEILLSMAAIGPPMVYVCNYSLAHKLFGRNSEDQQRLLSEPRVMLPDDPHGVDWKDYISECIRVSNGRIKADLLEFAEEVYRCTFGIKRLVVQLIKQAYIECRKDGRHYVEFSDLARAYRSAAYTSSASEVEALQLQALSNSKPKSRIDLYCPFELPVTMKSNVVQFAKTERQKRVAAKVFDSALTEPERSGLQHISGIDAQDPKPNKVSRKPPAMKLSEDEKAKAFMSYIDAVAPPPKPKRP